MVGDHKEDISEFEKEAGTVRILKLKPLPPKVCLRFNIIYKWQLILMIN
nr:hypothetical protein [Mucilaginibacter humi]